MEEYENYFGDETPDNKRFKTKEKPKPKKSKHKHEYIIIANKSPEEELEEKKDCEDNVMVDFKTYYKCKICDKEKRGMFLLTKKDLLEFKEKVDRKEIILKVSKV